MSSLILLSLLMLIYCKFITCAEQTSINDHTSSVNNRPDYSTQASYSTTTYNYNSTKSVPDGVTIIYTTIYTSNPTPTYIHSISNSGTARQKKKQNNNEEVDDPNSEDADDKEIRESIQKDQSALKRVVLILSLVGGLGVVAVVTTLIIFTRVKYRNKKQRELEEEPIEDNSQGPNSTLSQSVRDSNFEQDNTPSDSNNDNSSHSNHPHGNISDADRLSIEPSAPPALLMSLQDERTSHLPIVNYTCSQHTIQITTSSSQTSAPIPSAPTAKELDAMSEEADTSGGSSSYNHNPLLDHSIVTSLSTCRRCYPSIMPPEVPPPAYTPSAPPHYDMPPESPPP